MGTITVGAGSLFNPTGTLTQTAGNINLQGGAIGNQQPPFALSATWFSWSQGGKTLKELQADGHRFLICDNTKLPFADGSVDEVLTNNWQGVLAEAAHSGLRTPVGP